MNTSITIKYFVARLVIMTAITACTDLIDIDNDFPDDTLVIDGLITDMETPNVVKLSRAVKFQNVKRDIVHNPPEIDAEVYVEDDLNNRYYFYPKRGGAYETDPLEFKGQVGRIYTLFVTTQDNKRYRSAPEEMRNRGEFNNFETVFASKKALSGEGRIVNKFGVELLVDFQMDPVEETYIMWKVDYLTLNGPMNLERINIMSSENYTSRRFDNVSLDFVYKRNNYTATVTMLSIGAQTYRYWDLASRQRENGGSIFDPAPITLIGNVFNIDDEDKPVLGLFFVASATKRTRNFVIQ